MNYSSGQNSSRFFSVQRSVTESLTFRSCNSLEQQTLCLLFNSTFPSLPPWAKTLRTSSSYLVLLFNYSGECTILRLSMGNAANAITRGVPIIGTADILAGNILIFSVSVISTDSQRSRYKCRYSAYKINFYLTHAKECIATKSC